MDERAAAIQVLVVQLWTHDVRPIRDALTAAGLEVAITRVDIEPALHAVLASRPFDLVIYDPAITTISKATVEDSVRASRGGVAMLVATDVATLGARACEILRSRAC